MVRALLVIDVQQEYFTGMLPVSYPAGHLEKILAVMDAATQAKVPVCVIRHHQPDPESPMFCLNSPAWQLHPAVEQRPRSILIEKQLPGSFTRTNLDAWLKELQVDTVTIAGYMTHMCCDTTAREAFHRGYKVEFLSDATGTLSVENSAGAATAEELHRCVLVAQQMFISEVLDADAWCRRISG